MRTVCALLQAILGLQWLGVAGAQDARKESRDVAVPQRPADDRLAPHRIEVLRRCSRRGHRHHLHGHGHPRRSVEAAHDAAERAAPEQGRAVRLVLA